MEGDRYEGMRVGRRNSKGTTYRDNIAARIRGERRCCPVPGISTSMSQQSLSSLDDGRVWSPQMLQDSYRPSGRCRLDRREEPPSNKKVATTANDPLIRCGNR